jgi:hypothetical protein
MNPEKRKARAKLKAQKAKQIQQPKSTVQKKMPYVPTQMTDEDFEQYKKMAQKSIMETQLHDLDVERRIAELVPLETPFALMIAKLDAALRAIPENDEISEDIETQIREVGIACNNYCGFETMLEAVTFFVRKRDQKLVELMWDGIGTWRA